MLIMSTIDLLHYLKRYGFEELKRSRLNVVVQKKNQTNPGRPITTTITNSASISPDQVKTICTNLGVPVPPQFASIS